VISLILHPTVKARHVMHRQIFTEVVFGKSKSKDLK
jgi:hypothetical protein